MASNLTNEINSADKLSQYISETQAMGLKILPPNINLSEMTLWKLAPMLDAGQISSVELVSAMLDAMRRREDSLGLRGRQQSGR